MRCRWFAKCTNDADKQVEHPTLGWVPCCDAHIAWLGDSPSKTQFVPPLAAAVLDRRPQAAAIMGVRKLPSWVDLGTAVQQQAVAIWDTCLTPGSAPSDPEVSE
jgi:hypothetical protein